MTLTPALAPLSVLAAALLPAFLPSSFLSPATPAGTPSALQASTPAAAAAPAPAQAPASAAPVTGPNPTSDALHAKHLVVFQREGRYGGWPANHGAWIWGNEIVVGFDNGLFEWRAKGHTISRAVTPVQSLARSRDGGETWTIEEPHDLAIPPGAKYQDSYPAGDGPAMADCPGGLDFTHPDMAFTARMTGNPGASRFYYSADRGKRWRGPYKLPNFGYAGTAARTDYVVNGKHDLSLFITLPKENGREGRPAMVRTRDGGKSWTLVATIGPEPSADDYAIMPATARDGARGLFTLIRHKGYLESFRSTDDGARWSSEGRSLETGRGNPASLITLRDGRLLATYGYRDVPYGIRARLSEDKGRTWSDEIVLRGDAGNDDVGYPRSVQRPDGRIVSVYYYNLDKDKERFIAATIWDAPAPRRTPAAGAARIVR